MALRWTDGKNWDFALLAGGGSEAEIIDFLDAFGLDQMPYGKPAFKDRDIYNRLFLSELPDKLERYQFLKGLGLQPLSLEDKGVLDALVQNLGEDPDDVKKEDFKRLLERLLEDNPELAKGRKKAAVDLGYRWTLTFLKAFASDLDYVRFFHGIGVKFDPSQAWSWILGEGPVELARLLSDLGYEFPEDEIDISARYPGWDVQSAEMLAFLAEKGVKIMSVAGGRPKETLIEAAKLGAAPKGSVFESMDEDVYRAFIEAGFPAKDIDIESVRSAGRDDLLQLLADYGVSSSDYTPDLLKSINATWKETDPSLLESALAGQVEVDWPKIVEALAYRYFSRRCVGEVDPIAVKTPWAEMFRQALSNTGEGLSFEATYKTGWRCTLPEDAEVVRLLCSKGACLKIEGGDPRLVLLYCDNATTDAILGVLGINRDDLDFEEMGTGEGAKGVSDYLMDADNLDAYDWLTQKAPALVPSASDAVKKSISAAEAHRWHTWEWLVLKRILESIEDGSMKDGRSAATNAYGLICKGDSEIAELYGKKIQLSDAQRRKLETDVSKKLEKDRGRCWSAEQKEEMNERAARLEILIDAADNQSQSASSDSAHQKKTPSKKMSITEAVRLAQEGIERGDSEALSVLAPFKGKVKEKKAVDLAMRIAAFGGSEQVKELFRLVEAGWDSGPALCVAIRNGNDSAAEGLIACGATLSVPHGQASKKQQEDPARYCRNAIYARCYQEIEQFFDYVLPEEHPAGKNEKWKATVPGEEIDEAAARALLARLHEKRLVNKLDARRLAITIFRTEGNGSDLFPLAKSLYEYSAGKAVDGQMEWGEYCRVEDLVGREFASDELDDYAFSVGDASRLRKRFEEGKSTIVQRPRSLRRFIPILTGEEIGTKTNLMKTLAENGYLEELKMVEAWDGAFTEKNVDEALAAAMEAGQVETQSYLLEKKRELFGDSGSLEL